MQKKIIYFFLLICNIGFSQTNSLEVLSASNVYQLSKKYQNSALWFQEIPHYNRDSSTYYYDKATNIIKKNAPIQYEQLASIYLQRSDFTTCNYALTGIDSLSRIGWFYHTKSEKKEQNSVLTYSFLINWARIKLDLGDHKTALKLFSKALLIAEDFKNPELIARNLMNKGVFYARYDLEKEKKVSFKNLSQSLSYYQKWGEAKKPTELFSIYRSMMAYYTDRNSDSVYFYFNKMQKLLQHTKNPLIPAWYYVCLGRELITSPLPEQTIISQNQYNEGKKNILNALKILETHKIKTSSITPYGYGLLGDLNLRDKQYDLAISNYKKSKSGYQYLNNRFASENMSKYVGEAYQQKGDLTNAILYFKKYFDESLVYMKEKNEGSLRENELQIDLLTQEKKLTQNKSQQIIYIIALLIVLSLLAVLFWNYSIKQKINNQLALLNTDLESKNVLLDKKNAENEVLLKEIHHRVKNNLEVVTSLLALQSEQIDDPYTKEAITQGENRVNSIGIVHQKLYQGSNLGAVEMKDYFLSLGESILYSLGAENRIDLNIAMNKIDLDIDVAVPLGLMVNELVTNCIKYAFPNGNKGIITIKLEKQTDNMLHLEVSDNGVGKSDLIQGTGFGGQLLSLLKHQLNGTMREEINNGTATIFDFKLKKTT